MSARSTIAVMIGGMMTHELEVSILAAPLEAIDRRVLSQAWYSALHHVDAARRSCEVKVQRRSPMACAACRNLPSMQGAGATTYLQAQRSVRAIGHVALDELAVLHRSQKSRLAAGIERAFGAAATPRRATFSLGRGNARVHVVLQTTPAGTMLVALCRPELRADVGQALAQARAALAARGIALDLRRLGGRACS